MEVLIKYGSEEQKVRLFYKYQFMKGLSSLSIHFSIFLPVEGYRIILRDIHEQKFFMII